MTSMSDKRLCGNNDTLVAAAMSPILLALKEIRYIDRAAAKAGLVNNATDRSGNTLLSSIYHYVFFSRSQRRSYYFRRKLSAILYFLFISN